MAVIWLMEVPAWIGAFAFWAYEIFGCVSWYISRASLKVMFLVAFMPFISFA